MAIRDPLDYRKPMTPWCTCCCPCQCFGQPCGSHYPIALPSMDALLDIEQLVNFGELKRPMPTRLEPPEIAP